MTQKTFDSTVSKENGITESIDIHELSKHYPLRKFHYIWMFIQATTPPYYTAQQLALYFLFVRTTAGCDFKYDLALMYMISIFCETLVIPITGYICDRFKRFNHIILVITFLINFILSIILYISFITKWSTSKQLLMVINIAQTLISMQFNNSLYKLIKLYINYDTAYTDYIKLDTVKNDNKCNNIQMTYFTRIGIWGRFMEQFIVIAMVIPSFFLMKQQYWNFEHVQYLILLSVTVFGIITLSLSLKIATIFHKNGDIYAVKHESQNGIKSWYFCESFKLLFTDNKITRYGIINVILVFLLADLLSSYEPLTIAGVDTDDNNKVLSNFCGNYLTYLMYQSCWSSLFSAIGALLYIYVLLPFVDTFRFYRYLYPISSVLVGAAVFIISGVDTDVNQTWLSLSLGFMFAFFEYAHQFDDWLNLAYINEEAVGFYQIVYAWSNNIWKIFGYLFLYFNILNVAVAFMIGILLLASVLQSLCFSKLFVQHKKESFMKLYVNSIY